MSNLFQEILDKLKKNEKEILIKKSGSTQDGGNEKIRSGQATYINCMVWKAKLLKCVLRKRFGVLF